MISFDKVKVLIEVSIYAVGGLSDGQSCQVQWSRGKNSIKSKMQTVDNKVAKFSDKFKLSSSLMMNNK
jgi:hypothetical protein